MIQKLVTILILIDGFLQYKRMVTRYKHFKSHNPYFNRWFSAIENMFEVLIFKQESQSLF